MQTDESAIEDKESGPFGMSLEEWAGVVKAEYDSSIGFVNNGELEGEREKALRAIRGDLSIPHLPNRSSSNDTSIDEAIEMIMPDLMDIFTGGDDVAAFEPIGPKDEVLAVQETEAVVHTVMDMNDGFNNIYDYCKDALSLKTGIFKVVWEKETTETKRIVDIQSQEQADSLQADIQNGTVTFDPETGKAEILETRDDERCAISVVAPEDLGVSADTIEIQKAPYCVQRSKMRLQELTAKGIETQSTDLADASNEDDSVSDARDTVETHDDEYINPAIDQLRLIEINEHYIRLSLEDNPKLRVFQVITSSDCSRVFSVEEVDVIPFACGTPYRNPHRFFGFSIVDKLLEVQKIKTSLYRMLLDSGYFAINNRHEIVQSGMARNTWSQFAKNEPGSGIIVKAAGTINPIKPSGLSFDAIGAIEFFSTVGENRSGVVRNAQGLNPDTLHDTAKGAQILMGQAQKRTRLIARLLAQGIKDMYLLTHRLTRTKGQPTTMRLRGKFVEVDPSEWGFRKDAKIKIGVGSGGREERLSVLNAILEKQVKAVELQGGVKGPLVNAENLHHAAEDFAKAAGLPDQRYFMNPEEYEAPPPQPSPEMLKLQAQQQQEQAKMQMAGQKMQADVQLGREKAMADIEMKRMVAEQQAQLDRAKAQHEAEMNTQKMQYEMQINAMKMQQDGAIKMSQNRAGGALDK